MSRNPNSGLFTVAVAVAAVGALWVGLPVGTLALLAVVLLCPLMIFMMRGMHGGSNGDSMATAMATARETRVRTSATPHHSGSHR